MRIKRLDITGFKSFMERSVFSFDAGVTGIVGPNGCGKSNVVDAIRWAMGEQSAKNLRGRGMEDVIFNGSESHPALSMAEVSLTFQVDEGDLLAPQYAGFPEVTITRRLFRSGESEYQINKTTCRLLDITELFLGTGVGTRAYSIIEQGRVGQIVSSRPEDRRSFIEEAAGVTKYKARRKAAERKMEFTQQNLLRVNDLVSELSRRMESLARQAKKAEKYKQLKAEVRELELHAAAHRYLALIAESKVLAEKLTTLSGDEQQALAKVRDLEEAVAARRALLDEQGAAVVSLQQKVSELEGQLKLDDQNLGHWREQLAQSQQRIAEARAELDENERRRVELAQSVAATQEQLAQLAAEWKEDEVATRVAEEELRRVSALQAELTARIEEERGELLGIERRVANFESNLGNLERQRTDLETRKDKTAADLAGLRAEEDTLQRARDEIERQLEETKQLAQQLADQRGAEEASLQSARQGFAENEVQVIASRESLQDSKSRLHSLEEIQRNYEGFDRGVRAVMRRGHEAGREEGVFGLVAEVISAPERFEKAIEAALGDRLQHVIVDNREKAFELMEYLRSASEGRGSFLPLQSDGVAAPPPAPDLSRPGVLASAFAEVSCEEPLRPVVHALLGSVVIVSDLATAREYAASGGAAFTLVTLEGEVLRPDGSVTGGTMEGPAVGALQKRRAIAELASDVARLEAHYNEVLTRHYALQKQIGQSEGVLKGLAKTQHAEEVKWATQQKDLHKAGEDLARLRDRAASLQKEQSELEATLVALATEVEGSRGELLHGQTDREGRMERLRQLGLEHEGLRQKLESAGEQLTALKVKAASSAERKDAAAKELERLAAQRAELETRAERLLQQLAEGDARVGELTGRIEETDRTRAGVAQELAGWAEQLAAKRQTQAELAAQVRAEDGDLRELRGRLDELGQGLSDLSLKERELSLELGHLTNQVRERHSTELGDELGRFHMSHPLTPEAEKRLKDIKVQLEKMGEVNLTAIDEHAELSKRHEFLAAQKQDLESSLTQLQEAITKIDRTSRERFEQTFEAVNEKFQQIFPRLFGGGRAGLVLTREAPGSEPGVEIVSQPPGKKLQSVNLLSGGEKALTAVSMIFAIFLIKPTPFCLLDEVDAPLDEANVGRYNDMVREMSKQSQFILITHNKRTMEVADSLYGVTMEEPGVSKLVGVKLREATAANENKVA